MMMSRQLDFIERVMEGFGHPWFIAGGWAMDLGIGRMTREHEDMDICIFREHAQEALDYFSHWKIEVPVPGEGRLEPVASLSDIAAPRYGLHLHKGEQFIEILLTDQVDGRIPFRRDPSISIPVKDFSRTETAGRHFVAPEFQLLYKAKEGRAKDEHDFQAYLPTMSREQKEWLLNALEAHLPASPWVVELL